MTFVLDNSVAMRWCFEGEVHAYADAVLKLLESGRDDAAVPVLWLYEASNVIAREQSRGTLTVQEANELITYLQALNISVDEESTRRILPDAYRLALTYRLTSYDAAYLELALRRNLPFATLDGELIRACEAAGVPIVPAIP